MPVSQFFHITHDLRKGEEKDGLVQNYLDHVDIFAGYKYENPKLPSYKDIKPLGYLDEHVASDLIQHCFTGGTIIDLQKKCRNFFTDPQLNTSFNTQKFSVTTEYVQELTTRLHKCMKQKACIYGTRNDETLQYKYKLHIIGWK